MTTLVSGCYRTLESEVEMRPFRDLDRKTLTSSVKVQMMTLVSACYRTFESDSRNETFSRSQLKDTDISRKGADDDVSLCVLPDP